MHSATSPTYTGWNLASARASAITGAMRRSRANRLRNASSRPKITDGWTIVQSSPDAATAASASPLLRR